ncbi:VanZ family protein [Luteimonas sp. YGD11-2]|uniref:VanZ family protein n=1 Tax=Luteimonas sp. YGD11-2 TaxID=2508168 RepID=UPI001F50BCBC|nr:VanZ family protein [Luteimonas sp. YGD11-2]
MSRLRPGRPLKPFRRPWLWAGLWIAAIATVLVASLSPAPPLPPVDNSDKLGHFLAYAVLAIGAVQLYARWASLLGAGIGLVLLGIGIEYAQGTLTATRMGDPADALANTLGVIAGLATRLTPWRDALLRFDGGRR